jgi:hypothetical protein
MIHILLCVKPNKQITSSIVDFYNRKRFHNILLQVVCDCDFFLWNGWTGHQLKWQTEDNSKCQMCHFFRSRQILQKPIVTIEGMQIQLCLLGDAVYHIRLYLFKGYKLEIMMW